MDSKPSLGDVEGQRKQTPIHLWGKDTAVGSGALARLDYGGGSRWETFEIEMLVSGEAQVMVTLLKGEGDVDGGIYSRKCGRDAQGSG